MKLMGPDPNIHANCLIIGNKGILVCGPSGSGKTMLMLRLLRQASSNDQFATMVADDQVFVSNRGGRLIAMVPPTIKGQVELRGFGIDRQPYLPSTIINLVVNIIAPDKLDRYPEKNTQTIESVCLPSVFVPQNQWEQAIHIISAKLDP